MSKTIDQKVVEMQFDNQHFEKNVQTSLSTLEKLKQSLNFKGATDGLNNLEKASNSFSMGGIGTAVDTVQSKFSAFEVMSITALANITNSAVNAGKKIVKALAIDPVTTGFQEYETQIGAVQTILANTQHSGTTLEDVNAALDELNTYADKTIYNFTQMTRNIGTFTAAGIELDKSVQSIKGIANLAAVSGSTSQQASTAMYQLSQALAAGKVSLMDWNSVVNAGMGGKLFQDALLRTSEMLQTGGKEAVKMYGSFRESLTKGQWLTTEVLTETLAQLSGAYSEADLIAQGYSKKQAEEIVTLSKTAEDAATKVKTFTQLFETLKEAAQSGWTQTWEIIVGDFEESKEFMTRLSEIFGGVIEVISSVRNKILGNALTSKWEQLTKKIEAAGISSEKFDDTLTEVLKENGIVVDDMIKKYGSLKNAFQKGKIPANMLTKTIKKLVGIEEESIKSTDGMTKSTKDLGKVVDEVLAGKWGDGEKRIKALTEAGYDYAAVQNKVNEILGSSVKHLSTLTEEQKKNAEQLSKLSDAQLKSKGYTDKQIKALRELEDAAEKGGTSINDLIDAIEKPSGRTLLLESIFNILDAIGEVLKIVGEAWNNVFGENTIDEASDGLYGVIESFHKLTESMGLSEDAANNFRSVMEGVFSIFQMSNSIISASLPSALKILTAVLGLFGMNLGDALAMVGELIKQFAKWVEENTMFIGMIDKIAEVIVAVIEGVAGCIEAFKDLEIVQRTVSKVWGAITKFFEDLGLIFTGFSAGDIAATIKGVFEDIENWIRKLDGNEVAKNFMEGLANGFVAGIGMIANIITNIGELVLNTIMGIWDEHSPSKKAEEIGENFMVGLYNGLKNGTITVWEALKQFGLKCIEILTKVDYGQLFAGGIIVGTLLLFKQLVDSIQILNKPFDALSGMLGCLEGMFSSIGSGVKNVADAMAENIKAKVWAARAEAIKSLAIAIGILAASVYVLSKIETNDLIKAGIAIGVLAGVLAILMLLASKTQGVAKLAISTGTILGISASLILIAIALRTLSKIELDDVPSILATFAIAVAGLGALIIAIDKFSTPGQEKAIVKMGRMLTKMAVAFLLMTAVIKLAAGISKGELNNATGVLGTITAMFVILIGMSSFTDKHVSKVGGMILKMSLALGLMVGVIKLASGLDASEVLKGTGVILLVGSLFAAMVKVSQYAGEHAAKAGAMLLMASIALMMMTQVIKVAAGIDGKDVAKGVAVVAALEILFAGLIWVSKYAGPQAIKAGAMLLLISGALLVLTGVIFVLSNIDPSGLRNAVIAISTLGVIFMGLIAVTKYAQEVKTTLIVITVAIGMLSILILALSFIKPEKIAPAVAAITIVMGAFALLISATRFAAPVRRALTTLVMLTVILGALTGVIAILANMKNSDQALKATIALSVLLVAFSASMTIISKADSTYTLAWSGIVKMLVIVAGLAAILGALAYLKIEPSIKTAVAIGILLNAMAIALNILNTVAPTATSALIPLAVMGLIVAELAVVLYAMSKLDINPSIDTAISLSILIMAMSAALVPLTTIGAFWGPALAGIGVLAAFIAGIGSLIVAIGALTTEFPKLQGFLDTGIPVIEQIGYALGSFFGNIIGGFTTGISAGLPAIGTDLSEFMTNAKPFFDGLSSVNSSAVDSAKALSEMIFILTGANIIQAVSSFFGFGKVSLEAFGRELSSFAPHFSKYAEAIKGVDSSAVEASANAAKSLAIFASEVPNMGGLASLFAGENSLATFGKELAIFGPYIKTYSDSIKGVDASSIEASANAAKTLAEFANNIPNTGGLATIFSGDNDLLTFAYQLIPFGTSIKAYSDVVKGIDADAVTGSANAAKAIAELAKTLPNSGGIASWFAGENDIDDFGLKLVPFGNSIKSYSSSVAGIDVDAVKSSTSAIKSIVKAINATADVDTSGIIAFKGAIASLATVSLTDFVNGFKGSSPELKSIGSNMIYSLIDGLKSRKEALNSTVLGLVKEVLLKVDSQKVAFKARGIELISNMINGFSSTKSRVSRSMTTTMDGLVTNIRGYYEKFYNAGAHLVNGFANGISANSYKAAAKSRAMASAAANAARRELDEHSPSKVGYEIGDFFGIAFVNAISDYAIKAYKASANMASSAKEGLKNSISKIGSFVGDNIDANPTIRPVLDLTDVKSGIGEMDGIFSQGAIVNAGVIGSMMNLRNQNGVNDDVVSAINKLRSELGNVGNTQYNINGLSYEDGAVADAIRTIVRAAKVERRA